MEGAGFKGGVQGAHVQYEGNEGKKVYEPGKSTFLINLTSCSLLLSLPFRYCVFFSVTDSGPFLSNHTYI